MDTLQPRIERIIEKKLIGIRMKMSIQHNLTTTLWRTFSPQIPQIKHRISSDLISLQEYGAGYFKDFSPTESFVKWAAVEVSNLSAIPPRLDSMIIPAGLYAIFHYKGSSADTRIFQYIYGSWAPTSQYEIADRPHFEILGKKYRNNDINSEEEIWIPIALK